MAAKYFRSIRKSDGAESLIRAGNAKQALLAASGSGSGIIPATDEQIEAHFKDGGELHHSSKPAGEGKLFLAPIGDGQQALIRAKNPAEAFAALNADAYEIQQCSQDALVDLISKLGAKAIIHYTEPSKPLKKGGTGLDGSATSNAGGNAEGEPKSTGEHAEDQPGLQLGNTGEAGGDGLAAH